VAIRRPVRFTILALVIAAAIGAFAMAGPPAPTPNPPGAFSFAAFGDAPYFPWEDIKYRLVLKDIDAHDLSLVLHVGDIWWHPCTDDQYRRSLTRFNRLRHPVIYTPGDNEWADCWEPNSGGFAPLERLNRLREILLAHPGRSLGGRQVSVASQADREPFRAFVENVRWSDRGILFTTVHLVGSDNAGRAFPNRSSVDDEAVTRRTEAAAAWLREAFADAKAENALAVVVAFHANPAFEQRGDHPERVVFEPFLTALEDELDAFANPVLVVHGDNHHYLVDHPLVHRKTGRRFDHMTRLQVPGSPAVGWVRVVVTPGSASPFAFEPRVVPGWKYW
jgi:hypothetical protein